MRIKYIPQRNDQFLTYEFDGEVITATLDGVNDVFDFSGLPDGEAAEIQTMLPINPIISARRVNGVLEVELLHYHGPNASESERFPTWQEVV